MPMRWNPFQQLNYSKFIPPKAHPQYFARPRLIERLDQTESHKYTLLHAPEGYGKTSLLSDWYHKTVAGNPDRRVVWFRVDANDRDPDCFWGNLIELMDQCWPGIRKAVVDSMELLEQSSPNQMVLVLANYIARFSEDRVHYTLIFDDFDSFAISDSESLFFIFADMLPSSVNIIIASKIYLSNRLIEQDAYSKFSLIGVPELSLTKYEIRELLDNNSTSDVSDELVDVMHMKSEGWPLALYILIEEVQSGKDIETAIRELSGNDRFLGDAVFQKATRDLPQKVMMFLLETSFFERFCAPLCDYVSENQEAQSIIEHLERNGLFIFPIDSSHTWYRYHYLFAEWLRSQAMSLHRDQIRILNHKAGYWYRSNKKQLLSAKHVVAASEGDLVLGLAKSVFNRSPIGKQKLLPWLFDLQEKDLKEEPFFCLLAAWAYAYSGRPNDATSWLALTVEHVKRGDTDSTGLKRSRPYDGSNFLRASDADLPNRLELTSRVIYSKCFTLSGDAEKGIETTKQLFDEMTPLLDDTMKMVLYQNLGEAYELIGRMEAAGKDYQKAMTIARVNEFEFLVGFSRYQLIHLAYTQGKLNEAEKLCRVALAECPPDFTVYGALCSILGLIELTQYRLDDLEMILKRAFSRVSPDRNIDIFLDACISRAQYLMTCRNYSEALLQLAVARQAITANHDVPPRGLAPLVYAQQIRLYIKLKDYESAEDIAREYDSLGFPDTVEGVLQRGILDAYLVIEKNEGTEETLRKLEMLATEAVEGKYILSLIEIYLLIVRLYYYSGKNADANRYLKKALELSKREQIVKTFLDEGDIIRLLLVELVGSRSLGYETDKLARRLISAFDAIAADTESTRSTLRWNDDTLHESAPFVDHWGLTNREAEVLQMLMRGMNRKDIAAEMCTSQNTVKTHISHIYEKMGVHSVSELLRTMMEHGA